MSIRASAKISREELKGFFDTIDDLALQFDNPNKARFDILTKIVRDGAKVIQNEARKEAPYEHGDLERSIVAQRSRVRGRRRKGVHVSVKHDLRKADFEHPEKSFQKVMANQYGLKTKDYTGTTYLKDAVIKKEAAVQDRIIRGFQSDIDKYVRQQAQKEAKRKPSRIRI